MPVKWKKTKHPGIRFYEHPTRKHGIQKDRYFTIRFQQKGKRVEEGLGWTSEGWSAGKAAVELAELKKAHLTGKGPVSLREKREKEIDRKEAERAKKDREARELVTFGYFFTNTYFPVSKINKKPASYNTERSYFKKWIDPVLGKIPFKNIRPLNIEKIKKNMLIAKKSPRTIEYNFAIIRQIWNMARRDGVTNTKSPTKEVVLPKVKNERLRFLSHREADILLEELKTKSIQIYNVSLLALHCGLRAGEIFNLTWGNVDLERELINVDGKGEKTRPAFMTDKVRAMLEDLEYGAHDAPVFIDRNGRKIKIVSSTFQRTVTELGFNKGITDRRQKVVFHTLRHTFASWLAEEGTDLYVIQKLMGHASFAMVERYSHLGETRLHKAVKRLEKGINDFKANKAVQLDVAKTESNNGGPAGHLSVGK